MDQASAARKVLIVEDDQEVADLMLHCLQRDDFTATIARSGADAIQYVLHHEADLMLLDFQLPDMDGFAVLDALETQGKQIPFIVVTGCGNHQLVVQMMKRGARDYLTKDGSFIELLPSVVAQTFEQLQRDCRLAEAEQRIHDQNRFLTAVLDSLPHPLYVLDAETLSVLKRNQAALTCNRAAFSLVQSGRSEEGDPQDPLDSPIEEVRRTKSVLTLEHVHYDPGNQASVHEVYLYPVFGPEGEVRQVIEYNVDVTARKRAEQALRQSEARLRQVVESLPIILTSRDATSGRYTLAIGAVQEILGYPQRQFLENPDFILDIAHPQDVEMLRVALRENPAPPRPFEVEFRVRHGSDGRTVWLHLQAVPICDEESNLLRIDSILADVTREKQIAEQREQLESRLQQAHKLESLGILAGGIAHDFSNLLTIISGNLQYLNEALRLGPAEGKALTDMEAAVRNAMDMTRSLQAFSRPTRPQIVPTDANRLIQEVYRFLRRLMPVRIEFRYTPESLPCVVAADPAQLQQVLINLCINARDAMKGHGRLEIRTRRVKLEELPARLRAEAEEREYVEISVTDTGCGMDTETLDHAFDPFFTTKPKDQGTGLGLAIVYRIVRGHRGLIDVVSEADRGTDFRVYFPQAESAPPKPEAPAKISRGTERVLVVDDDQMIASLIKTVLERNGYEVAVAHKPEEAMSLARASSDLRLVVMDYELPEMTGGQCLQHLREISPQLEAVLITGYELREDELGLEHVRILQKPFSSHSVIEAVREALNGSTQTPKPQ